MKKRAPRRGARKMLGKKKYIRKGKQFRKMGPSRIRVKSNALNTSFSKIALRPNKFGVAMRKKYWLGAKNIWVSDTLTKADTGSTANGFQQDYIETAYFSRSDINSAISTLASGPGTTTPNNTCRYFLNKVIGEVMMTNSSNTNVEIDIYTFVPKRDTGVSPGQLFYQGMADQTTQVLTDWSRFQPNNPLDCVAVSSLYKCYKITHLQLNPGQSHRHSFTQHLCRPINNEVVKNANDQLLIGQRGISHHEVFVCRSTSIASGTGGVGEAFAPVKVNFNVYKKYELKYLFDNNTNESLTYSTPATTGLQVYNQGTGLAATPITI